MLSLVEDKDLYRLSNGTCVQMVKVATTLDVSIKLLWLKSMLLDSQRGYTMLGLGEIVIPGTGSAIRLLPMPGVKDRETSILLR